MKSTAVVLSVIFIFSACSSTKELGSSREESRKLRKLAEQTEIKKAVESRRYIVKVNRLYSYGGGHFDLVPRSNFLIVNGEIASISLGYIGRTFTSRPISGINLNARTSHYEMQKDETKGQYKIQMTVKYGSDKFDVYLNVGNSGYCDLTINNAYIQSVRYTGTIESIPLLQEALPVEEKSRI